MPLLIDGHNLIGRMRDLALSDPEDERKLTERVRRYAERTGRRITLVFDPAPGGSGAFQSRIPQRSQVGPVHVVFADAGDSADQVIRDRVGKVRDRQGLIVVTSDRAVAEFARQCGVRVTASDDFAAEMESQLVERAPVDDKPRASSAEVVLWKDVFKEPVASAVTAPVPVAPKISPAEAKRQRRMEQLRKQTRNQQKLI